MPATIETYDMTQILMPVQRPEDARQDSVKFGPSQTITKGMAIAIKTSDGLAYPFVNGQSDGTQNFKGLAMYSFVTDANGKIYYGPTASPSYRTGPWSTSPIWISGIFDPAELSTGTLVSEVDTFTPANVGIGDIFKVTLTKPDLTTVVAQYTATAATAANVVAGLIAAWNALADPYTKWIVASGTTTFILTGSGQPGVAFSAASTTVDGDASNTQTLTRAATTAASGISTANIISSRAGAMLLHNGFLRLP